MATLTTDMYMLSRSHERNVLSLAQWSRASDDSLGKSKGAKIGRERKRWEVEELSTIRIVLLRQNINSPVYDDSLSAQRLKYLSHRRHGRRFLQVFVLTSKTVVMVGTGDISLGGVPQFGAKAGPRSRTWAPRECGAEPLRQTTTPLRSRL